MSADHTTRRPSNRLLAMLMLALALLAASCAPLAPSPAPFATRAESLQLPTETATQPPPVSALASDTPAPALASNTPIPMEPLPASPTALSSEAADQTLEAQAALAAAETQFAQMQVTATPCDLPACYTLTPTKTLWMRPTRTPTATPRAPFASLYIWYPGPLSKVVSPIKLDATAHTGSSGMIRVTLLGEDGRELYNQVLHYGSHQDALVPLVMEVNYKISAVAETGRLVISTLDEFKRPIAIVTSDLILQSIGANEVFPGGDGQQPLIIQQPRAGQQFQGGTLQVQGLLRPMTDQPVEIELIDSHGVVIGSRQFLAEASANGEPVPFEIDVPYSVERGVENTRLVIRQDDTRITGTVALSSVQVWLKP